MELISSQKPANITKLLWFLEVVGANKNGICFPSKMAPQCEGADCRQPGQSVDFQVPSVQSVPTEICSFPGTPRAGTEWYLPQWRVVLSVCPTPGRRRGTVKENWWIPVLRHECDLVRLCMIWKNSHWEMTFLHQPGASTKEQLSKKKKKNSSFASLLVLKGKQGNRELRSHLIWEGCLLSSFSHAHALFHLFTFPTALS